MRQLAERWLEVDDAIHRAMCDNADAGRKQEEGPVVQGLVDKLKPIDEELLAAIGKGGPRAVFRSDGRGVLVIGRTHRLVEDVPVIA